MDQKKLVRLARFSIIPFFLFIISIFFSLDLFLREGIPITFDAPTHIANMAQVHEGLKSGDVPVRWGSGWARYGWPAPLFAQQTTSYIGAFFQFFTQNIVASYNLTVLLGVFLSSLMMYIFLRLHAGRVPAMVGTVLFCFAPYRIMNIYIRGALPEFYASIFLIIILIALHTVIVSQKHRGYVYFLFGIVGILLTHPFMLVVGALFSAPYTIFLLLQTRQNVLKKIVGLGIAGSLGLGIAAYYLLPLFLEIKYLYYGGTIDHFSRGHFLKLQQFFIDSWPYFSPSDIGPRPHVHIGGFIEGIVLLSGIMYALYGAFKSRKYHFLIFTAAIGVAYIILMLSASEWLYLYVPIFGNIQHPWRMLTGYIIIPPLILTLLLQNMKSSQQIIVGVLILFAVIVLRIPQVYGKNYTHAPERSFFLTDDNMHGTVMNTIWMGEVRDYPYHAEKISIIEGTGTISNLEVKNSSRTYSVSAKTHLKVVDHTFYFPGWKTYVDGQEIPIQFQDPNYRGVITYDLPQGEQSVSSIFTKTKPRILGEIISVIAICLGFVLFFLFRRNMWGLRRFITFSS